MLFLIFQKNIIMYKKELRIKYKQERKKLTSNEIDNLSIQIANQTLNIPIWDYTNFHIFLPIEKHNEINTEYIIHILLGRDKNVILSKSNFDELSMDHYLLTDNTKITINSYGIPEPTSGIKISDEDIDVVFIPLLAFDTKGNRVGYGKGFYDKFLKKCKPEVLKIGLNFFEAENEILDTYLNDIGLNFCITPQKVYTF